MNENKKIFKGLDIGFDHDNVITDWQKAARIWMSEHLPNIPCPAPEDEKTWGFASNFPEELCYEIGKMYYTPEPGFYFNMEPLPGAVETLMKLSEMGASISIVTSVLPYGHEEDLQYYGGSRNKQSQYWKQVVSEKMDWFMKYAPDLEKNLIPLHKKSLYGGKYLIDDRPDAGHGAKKTWKQILFNNNYGWIRPTDHPQTNWETMIKCLLGLEGHEMNEFGDKYVGAHF